MAIKPTTQLEKDAALLATGRIVRRLRGVRSQGAIGLVCGIPQGEFSKVEKGTRGLTLYAYSKLATALGCRAIEDLVPTVGEVRLAMAELMRRAKTAANADQERRHGA